MLEDGRKVAAGRSVKLWEARKHLKQCADIRHLKERDWRVVKLEGQPQLVAPIKRLSKTELELNGQIFVYRSKTKPTKEQNTNEIYYNTEIQTFNDILGKNVVVENISIKGSLIHFLKNEKQLEQQ
jgi:Zn/Cd-binding protein ZinT